MPQSLDRVRYLVGSAETVKQMPAIPAKKPFSEDIIAFLNDVSRYLEKIWIER